MKSEICHYTFKLFEDTNNAQIEKYTTFVTRKPKNIMIPFYAILANFDLISISWRGEEFVEEFDKREIISEFKLYCSPKYPVYKEVKLKSLSLTNSGNISIPETDEKEIVLEPKAMYIKDCKTASPQITRKKETLFWTYYYRDSSHFELDKDRLFEKIRKAVTSLNGGKEFTKNHLYLLRSGIKLKFN
jgi:hypothetical protein